MSRFWILSVTSCLSFTDPRNPDWRPSVRSSYQSLYGHTCLHWAPQGKRYPRHLVLQNPACCKIRKIYVVLFCMSLMFRSPTYVQEAYCDLVLSVVGHQWIKKTIYDKGFYLPTQINMYTIVSTWSVFCARI